MPWKLLVIDDDEKLNSLLRRFLGEFDFTVYTAGDATEGLKKVRTVSPDLIILDLMLRNLIDNAVKNTPEGGKPVVVYMARGKNYLNIVVQDWGVGIADSAMPHLFDPFYRTDSSRSRKTGGYGLGLSLCKAIVDAHNGKIDITSILGQGTHVTVMLPISEIKQF